MLKFAIQKRFAKLVGIIGHVGHGKTTIFEKLRLEHSHLQNDKFKALKVFPAFTSESGIIFMDPQVTNKLEINMFSCFIVTLASNTRQITKPVRGFLKKIKKERIPVIICFTKSDLKHDHSDSLLMDILENHKWIDVGRNDPMIHWSKNNDASDIYDVVETLDLIDKDVPSFCSKTIDSKNQGFASICFLSKHDNSEITQSDTLESGRNHICSVKTIICETGEKIIKPNRLKLEDNLAIISGWTSMPHTGDRIRTSNDRKSKILRRKQKSMSFNPENNKINSVTKFTRYYIHSHHIYSKTKRRDLLFHAGDLGLNGFTKPGKPGIIVIEGDRERVAQFWKIIKSWRWQHIELRHEDHVKSLDEFLFNEYVELGTTVGTTCSVDLQDLKNLFQRKNCVGVYDKLFGSTWTLDFKKPIECLESSTVSLEKNNIVFEDL